MLRWMELHLLKPNNDVVEGRCQDKEKDSDIHEKQKLVTNCNGQMPSSLNALVLNSCFNCFLIQGQHENLFLIETRKKHQYCAQHNKLGSDIVACCSSQILYDLGQVTIFHFLIFEWGIIFHCFTVLLRDKHLFR